MGHEQGYYTIAQVNELLADMQAQFDLRCAELQEEIESLKPKPVVWTAPGGSITSGSGRTVYTFNGDSMQKHHLHLVRDAFIQEEEEQ